MVKVKRKSTLKRYSVGDWVIIAVFILYCLTIAVPILNVVALSMSSAKSIALNKNMIIATDFDFRAYGIILSSLTIWKAVFLTIGTAVLQMIISLFMVLITGYVMSREGLPGLKFMRIYLIITMLFGGGLVPLYLVIRELGLLNNFWVHIVPGLLSAYNVFLMRNFIEQIPQDVLEAARIDGCTEAKIAISIILPLSLPILATLGVFILIGKWNDWFTAYMYIPDNKNLLLLQNIVRSYVVNSDSSTASSDLFPTDNATAYTNAILVFTTIPIVMIYPICLKYFTKGLYIGAVK